MQTIRVQLGPQSYDIMIAPGLLTRAGELCRKLPLGAKMVIVSNPVVASLYLDSIKPSLEEGGFSVTYLEIPEGETVKQLDIVERLHHQLAGLGLDRNSSLVALGGGVVGDIVGFVASTFLRGVNFIQVPTTLLAQVDSSVGGKTGVNLPSGKNLVGTFYQPKLVLMDTTTLDTLPGREFKTGLAEIVKYGVIRSRTLFETLEQQYCHSLEDGNPGGEVLASIIAECCQIKAEVVAKDEKEDEYRMILNLGHTVGHALEAVTNYQQYTHGEAVGLGMIAAAQIALEKEMFSEAEKTRLTGLLQNIDLPTTFPSIDMDVLIQAIYRDKKTQDEKLTFVLPTAIGKVDIIRDVEESLVRKAIKGLVEI